MTELKKISVKQIIRTAFAVKAARKSVERAGLRGHSLFAKNSMTLLARRNLEQEVEVRDVNVIRLEHTRSVKRRVWHGNSSKATQRLSDTTKVIYNRTHFLHVLEVVVE